MPEYKSPINGQPLPRGKPFTQGEAQREIARKGAAATNRKKKLKRTLREQFEILLEEEVTSKSGKRMSAQTGMASAILKQALDGNVRAAEYIRDIIGQKPAETVNVNTPDNDVMAEIRKRLDVHE